MAPSAVEIEQQASVADLANLKLKASSFREPLKSTGTLDKYTSIDITPVIGTEYPQVNLVELINAPNADELLRDLAIKSTPVSHLHLLSPYSLTLPQSPNAASSSCAPNPT
jgi:hypothetical protein